MDVKTCAICGKELTGLQRTTCSEKSCKLAQLRKYNEKYRANNREKFLASINRCYRNRMAKREPKKCADCGAILSSYHPTLCKSCKRKKAADRHREYRETHKEQEAKRKALWFQNNKKLVWERVKAKQLAEKALKLNDKKQEGDI